MSLIHWWPLNGDTKDYGVLNNNLSNSNAQIDNSGKIGKCYSFTYTSHQYMAFGDSSFMSNYINNHSFSIAYWTKAGSSVSSLCAIGLSYGVRIYNSTPIFSLYNTTRNATVRASVSITDGNWHHVCATYNIIDNSMKIYIDGVLSGSSTYPSGTYSSSWNNGQYIGYDPNNNTDDCWYDGKLNDIRIYDHVLSAKEVKELSKGLVLHYDFNDPYVEGTTNIDPSKTSISNWSDGGGVVSYVVGDYFGKQCYKFTMNKTSTSTVWSYMNCNPLTQGAAVGNTVTRSCLMYIPGGQTLPGWFTESIEGNSTNKKFVQYDYTKPNTWQRVSMTGTIADTGTNNYLHYFIASGATVSNFVWYMCDFQLEIKDHATPYVNGTRAAGKIFDCSGYGYNGIQQGEGIQIVSDSACGKYSARFDSNGSGTSWINTGGIEPLHNFTNLTYTAWVYQRGRTSDRACICIGNCYFTIDDVGRLSGYAYGKNPEGYHTGTQVIPLNTWTHLAIVWDDSYIYGYINGVQDFKIATTGTISYLGVNVGKESGLYRQLRGSIADFKIYATALSASDILAEYNRKASIDKSGILFTGEFEEGNSTNINITKTAMVKCNNIVEGSSNVKFIGGYTQLEYIESSGTQYIDTGHSVTNLTDVDITYALTSWSAVADIWGVTYPSHYDYSYLIRYNSSTAVMVHKGASSAQSSSSVSLNTKINIRTDTLNNRYFIDNVLGNHNLVSMTSQNYNAFIFASNIGSTYSTVYYGRSKAKLYNCKMYENNVLVRDFIPVKRNSDNVLGLYDLVNRVFYTNSGSGTFTAGPEIGKINAVYANEIKEI